MNIRISETKGALTPEAESLRTEFENFITPFIAKHRKNFTQDEMLVILYESLGYELSESRLLENIKAARVEREKRRSGYSSIQSKG